MNEHRLCVMLCVHNVPKVHANIMLCYERVHSLLTPQTCMYL